MTEKIQLEINLPLDATGQRLDAVATTVLSKFSRVQVQNWLLSGELLCNGQPAKAKQKVMPGDVLSLNATLEPQITDKPQDLGLDIVFEDEHLLLVNKPAGLVVHPAAGHAEGTLLNALLFHCPSLEKLARAGLVHRLDKDTSGLLVVAKTLEAQTSLIAQLQDRSMGREYDALVVGQPISGGTIDAPLGRHLKDRKRQAVVVGGKEAITHYRIAKKYRAHAHLKCNLETGRTHQIRVHLAYMRFPLVGDMTYGGRIKLPAGANEELKFALQNFKRQALHARSLTLVHPASGKTLSWSVPLPADMQMLLTLLDEDLRGAKPW